MAKSVPSLHPRLDLRDPEQFDLAVRFGMSWREMRRGAAAGALRDQLFGDGADALEAGQVDTLDLIVQRDEWRMSELAEALRVDPSTATRAVQRLVRSGLVERRTHVEDGRVVMVAATASGRSTFASLLKRRLNLVAVLLADFSPDEREQLTVLSARFVQAIDALVADLGG
jgi:DNA-binding MarR family transcriptional regulator